MTCVQSSRRWLPDRFHLFRSLPPFQSFDPVAGVHHIPMSRPPTTCGAIRDSLATKTCGAFRDIAPGPNRRNALHSMLSFRHGNCTSSLWANNREGPESSMVQLRVISHLLCLSPYLFSPIRAECPCWRGVGEMAGRSTAEKHGHCGPAFVAFRGSLLWRFGARPGRNALNSTHVIWRRNCNIACHSRKQTRQQEG
jgi:hypothetical protein